MAQSSEYHGGLVFPGDARNALARCSSIVQETLEDYGHAVEHSVTVTEDAAQLHTAAYSADLVLAPAGLPEDTAPAGDPRRPARPVPLRLTVALTPSFSGYDGHETSELLLAVVLYRLVQSLGATGIEWMDTSTPLTRAQFLSAFPGMEPDGTAPGKTARRFAPVEDTMSGVSRRCDMIMGRRSRPGRTGLVKMTEEERLALAFRAEPHPDELSAEETGGHPSSQLRLASWAMTGVVASVSAPVAVSLAAVNLVRGEDFRLNTQVLSLSAFVAFMHGSGAASAMSLLGV